MWARPDVGVLCRAVLGMSMAKICVLTPERMAAGLAVLTARDSDLAAVVERWGAPPLWDREPGFATLLQIILEQQVSLASARATFQRLLALTNPLSPESFLQIDDETLRALGFSRQKSRYGRALAAALVAGELDLDALATLPDDAVRTALIALPGIGPWTAEVYLMIALLRADAWPVSDLGVIVGVQQIKGLATTTRPGNVRQAGRNLATVAGRGNPAVVVRIFTGALFGVKGPTEINLT